MNNDLEVSETFWSNRPAPDDCKDVAEKKDNNLKEEDCSESCEYVFDSDEKIEGACIPCASSILRRLSRGDTDEVVRAVSVASGIPVSEVFKVVTTTTPYKIRLWLREPRVNNSCPGL